MIHKAVFLAALVTAVVTSTPQSSKRRRSDISCLSQGNYYSDRHAAETHGQSILEQKSGKDDPECPWAVARLAQASQLRRQIQLGLEPGTRLDSEPIDLLPPIFLDGIAWWDEFHMKVRLGHASAWEVLLCRHPDSGDLVSEQEGGIWDAEAPTTSAKYPGEARVCAGAAMFTVATPGALGDDGKRGITLPLFNYTGKPSSAPRPTRRPARPSWRGSSPLRAAGVARAAATRNAGPRPGKQSSRKRSGKSSSASLKGPGLTFALHTSCLYLRCPTLSSQCPYPTLDHGPRRLYQHGSFLWHDARARLLHLS